MSHFICGAVSFESEIVFFAELLLRFNDLFRHISLKFEQEIGFQIPRNILSLLVKTSLDGPEQVNLPFGSPNDFNIVVADFEQLKKFFTIN